MLLNILHRIGWTPTMRYVNRAENEHPEGHKALKLSDVPVLLGSGFEEQGAGKLTALVPGPSTESQQVLGINEQMRPFSLCP